MFRIFNCLVTEHDLRLVVIAGLICFLASFTAISLFGRARGLSGKARVNWIVAAGAATGCGIWATHFIAMLAYEPAVTVAYSVGLTVASLVVAVVVTFAGLAVAMSGRLRWAAPLGGAIVGGGIAGMHYLGMSALVVPGNVTWSADLVLASIGFGMVLAAVALHIASRRKDITGTLAAAVLLTLAIVSHHFTAMGAVQIVPDPMLSLAGNGETTLGRIVRAIDVPDVQPYQAPTREGTYISKDQM